jgi:hypothetical protein
MEYAKFYCSTSTLSVPRWQKSWNSLCSSLLPPVTSSLLGRNILLSTLFSNTLKMCFPLNMRDQVSHQHKPNRYILISKILNWMVARISWINLLRNFVNVNKTRNTITTAAGYDSTDTWSSKYETKAIVMCCVETSLLNKSQTAFTEHSRYVRRSYVDTHL